MSVASRKSGGLRLPPAEERLRAALTHLPNGCQVKTTFLNQKGYSRMTVKGKVVLCHRFAYEIAHGPIPEGLVVMHTCDNPPCCNPDHLELGTKGDNNRDMFSKGRGVRPPGRGDWKIPSEEVSKVRMLFLCGATKTAIAERYGVTRQAIHYHLKKAGLV